MWHEARKQERKIRGIMVDYKRRAERRRDFYERIKADPTQFLQIHGRPVKIHLDPSVAAAADSPANMMPWQGHPDILIDRFDVRAHLDVIPETSSHGDNPEEEYSREERWINYERYRIIVQNDFLGVGEEKFLHQLYLDEQYGPVSRPGEPEKKKRTEKAAIPYNYEEGTSSSQGVEEPEGESEKAEEEEDDDSDVDFDLSVDMNHVGPQQAHEMNMYGAAYGMGTSDFYTYLHRDIQEQESLRLAREQEEEKAMFSGRKSRRERRAFREKRLQGRRISPPSYATRTSPTYYPYRKSSSKSRSRSVTRSRSRSHSPLNSGQITYITSFGGEEEVTDDKKGKHTHLPFNGAADGGTHSKNNRSSYRTGGKGNYSSKWRSRRQSGSSPYRGYDRVRSPEASSYKSRSTEKRSNSRKARDRSDSRSPSRVNGAKRSRRRRSSSHSDSSRESPPPQPPPPPPPAPPRVKSNVHTKSPSNSQPPPPVRRYYGSRRGGHSSSENEFLDSDDESSSGKLSPPSSPLVATTNTATSSNSRTTVLKRLSSGIGNSGGGNKLLSKVTPQERLKKKMQALLNRQYKADKKAERMRYEKQEQERQDREDELREMAIKLRRRERERRHRMLDDNDGEDDEDDDEEEDENEDDEDDEDVDDDDNDDDDSNGTEDQNKSVEKAMDTAKPKSRSDSRSPSPSRKAGSSRKTGRKNRWDQVDSMKSDVETEHKKEICSRVEVEKHKSRRSSPLLHSQKRPLVDY